MIKEKYVQTTVNASYCTLNEWSGTTDRVWLVFHGYGQLAKFFIKKFELLDSKKNFVIAPQGLSKMYLAGHGGRVGASWMTREGRSMEIENQYRYIQSVLGEFGDAPNKELIYFGFSQGVATMGRYAAKAKHPFSQMIIWAGPFPPDIPDGSFDFLSGKEQLSYYASKEDPFFKEEMIEQQNEVVQKTLGKMPSLNWYRSGHQVVPELLTDI